MSPPAVTDDEPVTLGIVLPGESFSVPGDSEFVISTGRSWCGR